MRKSSSSRTAYFFVLLLSFFFIVFMAVRGLLLGMRIDVSSLWFYLTVSSVAVLSGFLLQKLFSHPDLKLFFGYIKFIGLVSLYSIVCVVAEYSAAWGNPRFSMWNLYAFLDKKVFGFDWVRADLWLMHHKTAVIFLGTMYSFISIIPLVLIFFLLAEDREDLVWRFLGYVVITYAVILAVFYAYPTIGPAFGMKKTTAVLTYTKSFFAALHKTGVYTIGFHSLDGLVRAQDPSGAYYMTGMISFPSDHATLAMGFAYFSYYLKKFMRILIWVAVFFMLVAAVPFGNHCIFDIVGGVLVAGWGVLMDRLAWERGKP